MKTDEQAYAGACKPPLAAGRLCWDLGSPPRNLVGYAEDCSSLGKWSEVMLRIAVPPSPDRLGYAEACSLLQQLLGYTGDYSAPDSWKVMLGTVSPPPNSWKAMLETVVPW